MIQETNQIEKKYDTSVKYMTIVAVLSTLIKFIRGPIIARFLSPQAYGIFALANSVIIALSNFTQMGVERIVVQRKELPDRFLSSCWAFKIMRGILISVLAMIFVPVYRSFIDSPDVTRVLLVILFVPLIRSFVSPGLNLYERDQKFSRVAKFEIIVEVLAFIQIIILTIYVRNVWALTWGLILNEVTKVIASAILFKIPVLPNIPTKDHLLELFNFGKHFFVIAVFTYITMQVDKLILGKFLGVEQLGYYLIAFAIISMPEQLIKRVVNRVSLPAFSRVQGDNRLLAMFFDKISITQIIFVVLIYVNIYLLADSIVEILYGTKWIKSIVLLKALSLMGIAKGIRLSLTSICIATGNVDVPSKAKILDGIVFVPIMLFLILKWESIGAAIGIGLVYSIGGIYSICLIFKRRIVNISAITLLSRFVELFVLSFFPVFVVVFFRKFIYIPESVIYAIIEESVFLLIIFILMFIFFKERSEAFISIFKKTEESLG